MNKTRIIMVLVAIALTMSVASATDWPQFQKLHAVQAEERALRS